jgi:DNA-binding transcriptional ArsR family regulator
MISSARQSQAKAAFTHVQCRTLPTSFLFLTTKAVGDRLRHMIDVAVIEDPAAAEAALDPIRMRLLALLSQPQSAAMLAAAAGLPRQKVNYHVRALESRGLVELVAERRKGNMTERILRSAAKSFVISPAALAPIAPDPAQEPDRLSASWLVSLAAQLVRDLGTLISASSRAGKRLATFALDGEVRFASAADRAAFSRELTQAVTGLVAKYHDEHAIGGRTHRLVVGIHPSVRDEREEA